MASSVVVIGGGIFGLSAALELKTRGHHVKVLDASPLPAPLAASTDISKVIRMEYGSDEFYMALMEQAREGWLAWNRQWQAEGDPPLYHETGVVMMARGPMRPGGFEYEGYQLLLKRGHEPIRLDNSTIKDRFPMWHSNIYEDGFFHAKGGYGESGKIIEALAKWLVQKGGEILAPCKAVTLVEQEGRIQGVKDVEGTVHEADEVVLAAGAWVPVIRGDLADAMWATGHPVFHLKPENPERFTSDTFPVFTADIAKSGYYGFPINQDGVVKVANHGPGVRLGPDDPREVTEADHKEMRAFLTRTFPELKDAEVVYTRLCLYADTQDEDFWITRDPDREGVTIATGGSGHGFKFGPVLGTLIADVVEQVDNPLLERFQWRPDLRLPHGNEAARYHGE